MNTNITVNVKKPGEVPVVPDDPVVPDTNAPETGQFTVLDTTSANSSMDGTTMTVVGIMSAVILVLVLILALITRKHNIKFILNRGRKAKTGLMLLAVVASFFSILGLRNLYNTYHSANAEEIGGITGDTLSITTEDVNLTVDLENDPVFAYTKNTVTVNTPTEAGYTLFAYIDGGTADLPNKTDSSKVIKSVAGAASQSLAANTWGMALTAPENENSAVFRGVPTSKNDALILAVKGTATEANDKTDVYYGTYVTPELPYGTYTGTKINYVAIANVVTDDVTVNYHGNGLYFDEEGTKDTNTVVYGSSCQMMYVGGNCTKAYTTEAPARIVKTPNLNDDGTQNGVYPMGEVTKESVLPVINEPITINGADKIKVKVKYGLTADTGFIGIIEGEWDGNSEPERYQAIWLDADEAAEKEFTFSGNTVTIYFESWDDTRNEGYDYGAYFEVYPIYAEKPESIDTVETTICHIAKSDNIDEEGNLTHSYTSSELVAPVSVLGAAKLKVDFKYAITAGTEVAVWEGNVNPMGGLVDDPLKVVYSDEENLSGEESFIINGDTATFYMGSWDEPEDGYNYGFYARIYPLYDEEKEGTSPIQFCSSSSFDNKAGAYKEPLDFHYEDDSFKWFMTIDDEILWFENESEVKQFLQDNFETYKNSTIDVYANNDYTISFDANGGTGTMDDIHAWATQSYVLPANSFTRTDYIFNGWNTEADGSGTAYADTEEVRDIASGGETIILYAQWLEPYISKLTYMQDFKDLSEEDKALVLDTMQENTTYNLIDSRDNKTYVVAKLKDGKIWMAENLDLGRTALSTDLTPENTNLATAVTAATFNSWKKTEGTGTFDAGEFISISGEDPISGTPYGTLYNYYATSAGTVSGEENYSDAAAYDICPAGWRLPTSHGTTDETGDDDHFVATGDFPDLYTYGYNTRSLMRAPITENGAGFALAGEFYDGAPTDQGYRGSYWSSSMDWIVYGLNITDDSYYFNTIGWLDRNEGHSIRCVVK